MNSNRDLFRPAHKIYGDALRKGLLVPAKSCEKCGRTGVRIHGHHDDYSQPLEVMWLCVSCHHWRHAETNTGHKGRPRCTVCGRIIFRHIMDSGSAREFGGGLAHMRCPESTVIRPNARLLAVALKYLNEEALDDVA